MAWARSLIAAAAWRASRQRLGPAVASDVESLGRRYQVEPDWKRTDDGYALRLDTRTTIGVTAPAGRWQSVDPRLPQDEWRAPWKVVGLVVWGSAVATGWWLGSRRGRGPLAVLRRDDEPGR